jgi:hypothetical protein
MRQPLRIIAERLLLARVCRHQHSPGTEAIRGKAAVSGDHARRSKMTPKRSWRSMKFPPIQVPSAPCGLLAHRCCRLEQPKRWATVLWCTVPRLGAPSTADLLSVLAMYWPSQTCETAFFRLNQLSAQDYSRTGDKCKAGASHLPAVFVPLLEDRQCGSRALYWFQL